MTSTDALATSFFDAIERGDLDRVRAAYAPDAVVWHNTDRQEQDVEANLRVLAWVVRNISERQYGDVQRAVLDDGFVQQHVLSGVGPNGARFAMPAMMRVWIRDGLITRLDEYLDSAQVAAMMA